MVTPAHTLLDASGQLLTPSFVAFPASENAALAASFTDPHYLDDLYFSLLDSRKWDLIPVEGVTIPDAYLARARRMPELEDREIRYVPYNKELIRNDFAFLQLRDVPEWRWRASATPYQSPPDLAGRIYRTAGYPSFLPNQPTMHEVSGYIAEAHPEGWLTLEGTLLPGMSGSPVFTTWRGRLGGMLLATDPTPSAAWGSGRSLVRPWDQRLIDYLRAR
jgi:hypothetical protein